MTDFGESQAEESLDEDLDENDVQPQPLDSDDEEEGEDLDKDLEDLIDDNEIEQSENEGSSDGDHKKRKKKQLSDAELEDEDYDLIEENLGIKVKRKKFRRIRMESGDESDNDNVANNKKKNDSRKLIADQLFEGDQSDNDDSNKIKQPIKKHTLAAHDLIGTGINGSDDEYNVEDEEDIDDLDDFIVDDEDGDYRAAPMKLKKSLSSAMKRHTSGNRISGSSKADFEGFLGGNDDVDAQDQRDLYEEGYEGEDGDYHETTDDRRKGSTKIDPEKFYEPAELEKRHMTLEDNVLRLQDAPERFLTRGMGSKPVTVPFTDTELQEEADWIYERAFSTYPISIQEVPGSLLSNTTAPSAANKSQNDNWENQSNNNVSSEQQEFHSNCQVGIDVNYALKPVTAIAKIREILNFMRNQGLEVPFIAHYRKEYFEPDLTVSDLWKILHWDERWSNFRDARDTLVSGIQTVMAFLQSSKLDSLSNYNQPTAYNDSILPITKDDLPDLTDIDVIKVKAIKSMEELEDMKQWFHLYFGSILRHVRAIEREKKEQTAVKTAQSTKNKNKNIFDSMGDSMDEVNEKSSPGQSDMNDESRDTHDQGAQEGKADQTPDNDTNLISSVKSKKPKKIGAYTACINAAIGRAVTKYFGIEAGQLGENMRDNYQKYEILQTPYDLSRVFDRQNLLDILTNQLLPKNDPNTTSVKATEREKVKAIREFDVILSRLLQMHKNEVDPESKQPLSEELTVDREQDLQRESLVKASKHVFAVRLSRDPMIRKCARTIFYDRAKITVKPAISSRNDESKNNNHDENSGKPILKGAEENLLTILDDETHPLYPCRYLKDKPIRDLYNDQFLRLQWGAEQGYVRLDLGMTPADHQLFLDELRPLIEKDEYGIVTRTWNELRSSALSLALTKHLYPMFAEELRIKLLREAIDCVLNSYALKLYSALKIGPYQVESGLQFGINDETDIHRSRLESIRQSYLGEDGSNAVAANFGVKVMGISYTLAQSPTPGLELGGSAVVCDRAGQVVATLRLPNLLKNKRSNYSTRVRTLKEDELTRLRTFISQHRPQVIAVGACEGSKLCLTLREELKDICLDLEQTVENFPPVAVVLVEEDVANIVQQKVSMREDVLSNTAAGAERGHASLRGERNLVKSMRPSDLYAKASHALAGKAVSLARRVQDPLLEFVQLFPDSNGSTSTALELENDIFCLNYEPMQDNLLSLRNRTIQSSTFSVTIDANSFQEKSVSGIGYYFDAIAENSESSRNDKTRKTFETLSISTRPLLSSGYTDSTDDSSFRSDLHRVAVQLFVNRVNDLGVDLNQLLALYSCRQQTVVGVGGIASTALANVDGNTAGAGGLRAADELAQSLNTLTLGASGTSGSLAITTSANCLVQFISGLGPRKGAALLKLLERRHQTLKADAGGLTAATLSSSSALLGYFGAAPLRNRTQLVTVCHMGPKVFVNCAGFVKIDTDSLALAEREGGRTNISASSGSADDYYLEPLDSTRIHPETYEWARKMAVDALEYDEEEEEEETGRTKKGKDAAESSSASSNEDEEDESRRKAKNKDKSLKKKQPKGPLDPSSALEAIFESPDKLKDLDLDAFAEELTRQGFGHKSATLYDIRTELTYRYKDNRIPPMEPTLEERFNLVTKETPYTFYIGRMLPVKAIGVAYVNPKKALERMSSYGGGGGGEMGQSDIDKAYNPVRNEENGLWGCPICNKSDFTELSEVWQHFDGDMCPGQPVGLKVRLDNGLNGFIHIKNMSDTANSVKSPEDIARIGTTLEARITKIDIERFSVEMSCKPSDISDLNNEFRPPKDSYYDYDLERLDMDKLAAHIKNIQLMNLQKGSSTSNASAKSAVVGPMICKRVISHPNFKNVTFHQAQHILDTQMSVGEALIRPSSSKGNDHLTLTWKIVDGVYQYIDIKEEGKDKPFTLGKSLWIGNEEFEDLDEIIARFVTPLAAFCRDISSHKYYFNEPFGLYRDKELKDMNEDDEIKHSLDSFLRETKRQMPSRIPYSFCASKEFPGKFILAFTPRQNTHYEYITLSPQGYRYRGRIFTTLNALVHWFKEHFRDMPAPSSVKNMSVTNAAASNEKQHYRPFPNQTAAGTSSSSVALGGGGGYQSAGRSVGADSNAHLSAVPSYNTTSGKSPFVTNAPAASAVNNYQQPNPLSANVSGEGSSSNNEIFWNNFNANLAQTQGLAPPVGQGGMAAHTYQPQQQLQQLDSNYGIGTGGGYMTPGYMAPPPSFPGSYIPAPVGQATYQLYDNNQQQQGNFQYQPRGRKTPQINNTPNYNEYR